MVFAGPEQCSDDMVFQLLVCCLVFLTIITTNIGIHSTQSRNLLPSSLLMRKVGEFQLGQNKLNIGFVLFRLKKN